MVKRSKGVSNAGLCRLLTAEDDCQCWPEDGPVYCPLPISAVTTGLFGAIAAIASLHGRAKGRRPAPVGIAMLDALAFCQEYAFMHAANVGEPPRNGGRHPTGTPSQVFPTKSGLFAIMAPSDEEFRRLCVALDVARVAAVRERLGPVTALVHNAADGVPHRIPDRNDIARRWRIAPRRWRDQDAKGRRPGAGAGRDGCSKER